MLRAAFIPCLCLSLFSCDKQDTPQTKSEDSPNQNPHFRRHHTNREDTVHESKRLRELISNADTLEGEEREKALASVAWSALELHPKIAVEAFQKMSSDRSEKIRLIHHYAMRLSSVDLDEAIEWAKSFESEMETSAAISYIAVAIAENEPERAAKLLSDFGIPGRDFDVAVVQVIQRWAAASAADAASWVALFPAGEVRQTGLNAIAERWLPKDAASAFRWMETIADVELRRETARAMQGQILQQPKETRDTWLQHVSPEILTELESQRAQALKDVGNNLIHTIN